MSRATVYTIGHSTRTREALVSILRAHGVRRLVDVRSIPRSRHNPQFNREDLAKALRARRLSYRHMKELGGRRRARPDSDANAGWRSAAFRGYADYMGTEEFAEGLRRLIALAAERPTAVMCAEAVPWRCHRSLIADALTARGIVVRHLMSPASARLHALNPMARLKRGRIVYPREASRPRAVTKPRRVRHGTSLRRRTRPRYSERDGRRLV